MEDEMTNEEIAKDLTVALVNKMTNPAPDNVSEVYLSILQKIGESRHIVTLQTIEDHLTKQDHNSFQRILIAVISFAGSIVVAGAMLWLTARPLTEEVTAQQRSSGESLVVLGIASLIIFLVLAAVLRKRGN